MANEVHGGKARRQHKRMKDEKKRRHDISKQNKQLKRQKKLMGRLAKEQNLERPMQGEATKRAIAERLKYDEPSNRNSS